MPSSALPSSTTAPAGASMSSIGTTVAGWASGSTTSPPRRVSSTDTRRFKSWISSTSRSRPGWVKSSFGAVEGEPMASSYAKRLSVCCPFFLPRREQFYQRPQNRKRQDQQRDGRQQALSRHKLQLVSGIAQKTLREQ